MLCIRVFVKLVNNGGLRPNIWLLRKDGGIFYVPYAGTQHFPHTPPFVKQESFEYDDQCAGYCTCFAVSYSWLCSRVVSNQKT